jgi:heme-degrading monooxygenase HmoA
LSAASVIEHVLLSITPGQEQAFEAAFVAGYRAISAAAGYEWASLVRQVEEPSTYLLLVGWTSLEAHTVEFRGSDLFADWRAAVGPYFAAPPKLTHYVEESVGGDRTVIVGVE